MQLKEFIHIPAKTIISVYVFYSILFPVYTLIFRISLGSGLVQEEKKKKGGRKICMWRKRTRTKTLSFAYCAHVDKDSKAS